MVLNALNEIRSFINISPITWLSYELPNAIAFKAISSVIGVITKSDGEKCHNALALGSDKNSKRLWQTDLFLFLIKFVTGCLLRVVSFLRMATQIKNTWIKGMQENVKAWATVCELLRQDIASKRLRIIIPTMNAEDYIDIILDFYEEIGLPITVFVDSKSKDTTRTRVEARGVETLVLNNPSAIVEGMIQELSIRSGTEWVLRMDDDELPSKAMLTHVQKVLSDKAIDSVGFPRLQCAVSDTAEIKASKLHPSTAHIQWRLYRPNKVSYSTQIHTPGFIPDGKTSAVAPIEATMIHLDWSLHSYDSRRAKVRRYDDHSAGLGSAWKNYYLWEDDKKHGNKNLSTVDLPEFSNTALSVKNRLLQNCVVEKSYLNAIKKWMVNLTNPTRH